MNTTQPVINFMPAFGKMPMQKIFDTFIDTPVDYFTVNKAYIEELSHRLNNGERMTLQIQSNYKEDLPYSFYEILYLNDDGNCYFCFMLDGRDTKFYIDDQYLLNYWSCSDDIDFKTSYREMYIMLNKEKMERDLKEKDDDCIKVRKI